MDFYSGSTARQRILNTPAVAPPPEIDHVDPPPPIDDDDGGADTDEPEWQGTDHAVAEGWYNGRPFPWFRQHPGIEIDENAGARFIFI